MRQKFSTGFSTVCSYMQLVSLELLKRVLVFGTFQYLGILVQTHCAVGPFIRFLRAGACVTLPPSMGPSAPSGVWLCISSA